MATKKAYDLCVAVGKYTDHDGNEKSRWLTIGAVLEKDDGGKFVILERSFNPAGIPHDESKGNTIIVSMFDPNKNQNGGSAGSHAQVSHSGNQAPGDDIPF